MDYRKKKKKKKSYISAALRLSKLSTFLIGTHFLQIVIFYR